MRAEGFFVLFFSGRIGAGVHLGAPFFFGVGGIIPYCLFRQSKSLSSQHVHKPTSCSKETKIPSESECNHPYPCRAE